MHDQIVVARGDDLPALVTGAFPRLVRPWVGDARGSPALHHFLSSLGAHPKARPTGAALQDAVTASEQGFLGPYDVVARDGQRARAREALHPPVSPRAGVRL